MKPKTVRRAGNYDPRPAPQSDLESGLTEGTIVLTADGEMPVEFLSAGDRVITRDLGMMQLRQVICRTVTTSAVFFAAGSLGDTRPETDLVLPSTQQVLVRDWRAQAMFGASQALVRAAKLVDGEFVRDLGQIELRLFVLRFERPLVIYAGGLELGCRAAEPETMQPVPAMARPERVSSRLLDLE